MKQLVGTVRGELGLSDKLAPKQAMSEVVNFVETTCKPPKSVVGLRGETEWALVLLFGMARSQELIRVAPPQVDVEPSDVGPP